MLPPVTLFPSIHPSMTKADARKVHITASVYRYRTMDGWMEKIRAKAGPFPGAPWPWVDPRIPSRSQPSWSLADPVPIWVEGCQIPDTTMTWTNHLDELEAIDHPSAYEYEYEYKKRSSHTRVWTPGIQYEYSILRRGDRTSSLNAEEACDLAYVLVRALAQRRAASS